MRRRGWSRMSRRCGRENGCPSPISAIRPKKQTETEHKPHMKLQERIPLNQIYKNSEQLYKNPEEEFSDDLAEHLDALKVGRFEDAETEGEGWQQEGGHRRDRRRRNAGH